MTRLATNIRPATLDDLPMLREFEQGVVEAERPVAINLSAGAVTYYDLEQLIIADNSELVVLEQGTDMVGCGYARIEESKPYKKSRQHCYLGFMYVAPSWRGQGLNREIMDYLFDWGQQQGVRVFQLDVYANNAAAVNAYAKLGFKPNLLEMVLET